MMTCLQNGSHVQAASVVPCQTTALLFRHHFLEKTSKDCQTQSETHYAEARKSISSESYTACVLVCRKILMNVAVGKGAPKGDTFTRYIDYLVQTGYITVTMKEWVDKIRDNGNDATHEIPPPDSEKAGTTLEFTVLLLKNVYETAYRMKPDPVSSG